MPLFAILFFILCLANCGAPLSLNFIGEFLSLYGVFERSFLFGLYASSSIVFSAAYTIYMYQKISFGGSYTRMFTINFPDLNKKEFMILLTLVIATVFFLVYTLHQYWMVFIIQCPLLFTALIILQLAVMHPKLLTVQYNIFLLKRTMRKFNLKCTNLKNLSSILFSYLILF